MAEESPDHSARGFVSGVVDPARYEQFDDRPFEAAGAILQLIPKGARVLDVGCGTGILSALIRDRCEAEVVGIEPDPDRVRMGRERGLDIRTGILDASTPDLGRFDIVLFADVLEHIVDPSQVLLDARAVLKAGGRIVASIPNVAHWTVRFDLARGRFEYVDSGIMDGTHVRWFTLDNVRKLFRSAGFGLETWRVTAGTRLAAYQNRRPWKMLKPDLRDRLVEGAARRFPTLFGCQFIVRSTPAEEHAPVEGERASV